MAAVRRHLQPPDAAYGDELIDRSEAGLAELLDAPAGRRQRRTRSRRFLEGLPRRYLQLFSREAIYRHVRLSRDIQPDDVHRPLERKGNAWELTVVTLDKPFLFSNICGVLSSFGMDILRGHALTNPNGLVLDIFQFTDEERFLELNADGQAQLLNVLAGRRGRAAPTSRRGCAAREQRRAPPARRPRASAPVDPLRQQSSRRYTILDIVADNALGLLYRISRVISRHGCDVDLVLIATEGEKAIDVFHITHGGAKLSEAEQLRADRRSATHAGGDRMKLIKAIVRPNKVDEVKDALGKLNISGMTVTEVRGHGKQKGHTAIYRGKEYNVSLLPKMEIEIVVPDRDRRRGRQGDHRRRPAPGEIGDGRVFVMPVAESYKIRTGESEPA